MGLRPTTLTDDENRPIKPFNFHDSQRFKCGSTDAAMYKDFMTGLDGSPMPSFSDNVKPDEAWELVMYLRTLQPDDTKEKQIARQLGLTPINPIEPLPDTSAPSDSGATGAQYSGDSAGEQFNSCAVLESAAVQQFRKPNRQQLSLRRPFDES